MSVVSLKDYKIEKYSNIIEEYLHSLAADDLALDKLHFLYLQGVTADDIIKYGVEKDLMTIQGELKNVD